MADINEFRLERAEEIEMETLWDCHEHEYFSQEHIEQCLDKMMAAYIGDERNYVVDGAEIECSEMCKVSHCIKYENGKTKLYNVTWEAKGIERDYIPPGKEQGKAFYFGREQDVTKVRRLYTLHANGASDNGIRFATVLDRDCLRDVKEGVLRPAKPDAGMQTSCAANIISCGNCRIMRESDIAEIEKRWDESMKYGTCYSLIKPVTEWVNPPCAESVSGNCDTNNSFASDIGVGEVGVDTTECNNPEHHKVMKFDTKYGQREGLTMMSSLLCTRGGVITITFHGQIYLDGGECFAEETEDIFEIEKGEDVNVKEKILELLEMENGIQLVSEYLDRMKAENPDYVQFLEALASHESSGMYDVTNGQYLGRYQIGNDVFNDIGFKDGDQWSDLARALGVNDRDSYLNNQTAQEVAILFALRWDYYYVLDNGDTARIGEYVDGVKVTTSGLVAAAHLVGHNDLHRAFSGEQSWNDTRDGNKVKASTYMEEMGGLDLTGILGGVE